eukprot:gene10218-12531_t
MVNWFNLTIVFILADYFFKLYLNSRQLKKYQITETPEYIEKLNVTTNEKFRTSQKYGRDKMIFSNVSSTFSLCLSLGALFYNGLPAIWNYSLEFIKKYGYNADNEIIRSLVFVQIIILILTVTDLPFSYYYSFQLEQKYGYNNMTRLLFLKDKVLGVLITTVLMQPLIAALIYVIQITGSLFWLYAWGLVFAFSLFSITIYPVLIAPLFNKYTPIEGELKDSIFELAKRVDFPASKLFVCDNSRRDSHMNAYFYGFFKNKRIVLYDTLVKELSREELLAVLCHEFGHYKMNHTFYLITFQQVYILMFFYLFGLFINETSLYNGFGFDTPTVLIGLILFSILYTPMDQIFSFGMNIFSRKFEYQADDYALKLGYDTTNALVKLHVKDGAPLIVDPIYSAYHHSHPTLLERINNIKDQVEKIE